MIFNTDSNTFEMYKSVQTINYLPSGVAESTVTSDLAWFPVGNGPRSLGCIGGIGTLASTNWAATPTGTVILDIPNSTVFAVYNNNSANGAGLIWTCPVAVPIGVYEIVYAATYAIDRPIIEVSVSFDNGSNYTFLSSGDHYRSSFSQFDLLVYRYVPNTTAGATMKVKFVSNGKNASAATSPLYPGST
jgi:hypothetical protein